jgi:TolB-like protein
MSACNSKTDVPETKIELSGFEKILVLPFKNLTQQQGENGIIRCPACGTAFAAGKVTEASVHLLTEHLLSFLQNNTHFKIVPSHRPITARSESFTSSAPIFAEQEILVSAARAAETDWVLAGYIFRYKQRIGTQYSVQSPASVAFSLHLIGATDGKSIWYGHYDETQQSLSENLFRLKKFLKRKWKWITVEEMAISGLEELLKTFPMP